MPFYIIRQDITRMTTDAIVNAANSSLLGGGGVDGCIHRAAGAGLLEECRRLGGCETGCAKITGAYDLPCKYIIHTVGPVWMGGNADEKRLLEACYRNSLLLAQQNGCESVAFPLISAGAYGYPNDEALRVAVDTIEEFLQDCDMTVYLTVFDRAAFDIGARRFEDIAQYIDDVYVQEHTDVSNRSARYKASRMLAAPKGASPKAVASKPVAAMPVCAQCSECAADVSAYPDDLSARLKMLDESFSQMLLRLIDESGMTDAQCYKKANIDRKLFSKIRSDVGYRPSKQTAIAFAVALQLSLADTNELLKKAGFALSHSSKFDIIIEYFISKGIYDVFEINQALFAFDQSLLG